MIISLFYYIYKDKCKDDFKRFLDDAVENKWSIETLYQYIFDNIKRSSSEYIDPSDKEVCLKLDYEEIGTGTGEIETVIRGYSLGYKPIIDNREEKKDDSMVKFVKFSLTLLAGFLLGRKSVPFRRYNPKKDKIKFPEMFYDNEKLNVTSEQFHDILDWYTGKEIELFTNNDLYICKGKRRRKK